MAAQFLLRGAAALGLTSEPWSAKEAAAPIVIATPVGSYHNATLQVYAQLLRDMGHTVTEVTDIPHAKMYPHFTGADGANRYIDMVVSSDLPNNHATWLGAHKDTFNVVGTCYDFLQIYLAAPSYSGIKTLSEVKDAPGMNKTLIGFDIDPCAICPTLANKWIKEELGEGFTYMPFSQADLKTELTRKLAAKEVFATTMWSPTYWNALFPELQQLDMGRYTADLFNQGKVVVSTASPLITDPANARTLRAVSSVFIGDEQLTKIDYEIYKYKQKGGAEYDDAPYIAAQQWIKDNRKTYEMFSWR